MNFGKFAKWYGGGLALVAVLSATADAQEWPKKMFETLEHDFGTVARGSDTEFKFEVTNKFVEDVHIQSVRSSCGCTSPSIENNLIKTYEKGYIVAKFNTRGSFTGPHSATLTVTIDKPFPAQVQLRVHGNIRGDVVFKPGSVRFEDVDQGTPQVQKVTVSYAGRSGWKINDVVTSTDSSNHYEVELTETQRVGGLVKYDLLVRLKESAPAGYLKDELVLVTNDSANPRIPLDLEGRVAPEISVAPENLVLGEIAQGAAIPKKLIVRGKKEFKITDVECDEDGFTFDFAPEAKKTHVVTVNFNAGSEEGRLKKEIRVLTDLGETYTAVCTAYATIVASPDSDASPDSSEVERERGDSSNNATASGESRPANGDVAGNR